MPKNLNLIVSLVSFLSQIMNWTMNMRITQDIHGTRAMTFVFMEKTEKLQERTFREKILFYYLKKKNVLYTLFFIYLLFSSNFWVLEKTPRNYSLHFWNIESCWVRPFGHPNPIPTSPTFSLVFYAPKYLQHRRRKNPSVAIDTITTSKAKDTTPPLSYQK